MHSCHYLTYAHTSIHDTRTHEALIVHTQYPCRVYATGIHAAFKAHMRVREDHTDTADRGAHAHCYT